FQVAQALQYFIKALPVAGSLAYTAIYHQVFRALSHFGVQVVLYHAVSCFAYPALAIQCIACGRFDDPMFYFTHVYASWKGKNTKPNQAEKYINMQYYENDSLIPESV